MRADTLPALLPPSGAVRALREWSRAHPGAVTMAGLLALAAPLKFFLGALSLMRQPSAATVAGLALWWLAFAGLFWVSLLAAGHLGERWSRGAGRAARVALWLGLACACAVVANLATAGRARILIEQGVVQGVLPMHLYGFVLSFTLALLYFALLGRSRLHEGAAARLASAQRAQREARRRSVQLDLQAVQARIDPALLFGMLEAVRKAYEEDPPRAERLLDELIAFLRASLPHPGRQASSVPREAELARAYTRLLALAQGATWYMTLAVSDAARHARFPPGALLPLVDDALRSRGGDCALRASCVGGTCRVVLDLPARPSDAAVARVHALLQEAEGSAAGVAAGPPGERAAVALMVPHEDA